MKQRTRFFQTCLGVFQGGGCRAAGFVGALSEAYERGVDYAGVAGTSAGSIIAALLGAGATPNYLNTTVGKLDFQSLLEPPDQLATPTSQGFWAGKGMALAGVFVPEVPKIWKSHGLYSSRGIETWIDQRLKELIPGVSRVTFKHLPLPTFVIAADVYTNDVKVWSSISTPDEEVAYAVRCSCSIPAFFQPVQGRYIDGGILSNLPAFVFSGSGFDQNKPLANRILAYTLIAARNSSPPANSMELFGAIASTVVDGASMLQGRLVGSIHEIAINTGDIRATDFDKMNEPKIAWLLGEGKKAAQKFFDQELSQVKSSRQRPNDLSGDDELYSAITELLDDAQIKDIVISDSNARWVYALFPTLLAWRCRGARVRVILPSTDGAGPHEIYQRRVLRALGCELIISAVKFRGFLFNPGDEALARAITIPEAAGLNNVAVRYYSPHDFPVINGLFASLSITNKTDPKKLSVTPSLVSVGDQSVLSKLKQYVSAYASVSARLSMQTIPLNSIVLMTRMVRGFKYKQIRQMFDLFSNAELTPFETAEIRYSDDLSTIVTPPVVERAGDRHILVQGNTRAVYCYKNGIDELRCVVVRDHATPLPSEQRIELKDVLIGDRTISTRERYGSEIDKDYRSIELATHRPENTLINAEL